MIFGFHARAFLTDELLETMGEIYCQGRRKAETQAVCLELGPLCSILEFSVPTQPLPRPAGVIRGAYTGAVQAYLTFSLALQGKAPRGRGETFSIKLLIFLARNFAVSLYFAQTLLRLA